MQIQNNKYRVIILLLLSLPSNFEVFFPTCLIISLLVLLAASDFI